MCSRSVNALEPAADSRTDMRSVRVIRHTNQVQYVEPQEDHTFLLPLSPQLFNFRHKCFWLYRCVL